MTVFWRNLLVTVVLAFAAAYVGARLGARTPARHEPLLRDSVYQMVHHDLKLTSAQQAAIGQIDQRYEHRRNALRADVGSGDAELAQALASEMALGTSAERALSHIQASLAEMQRDSVVYVLEVRGVLNPDQQMLLDRKVLDTLALGPILTEPPPVSDSQLVAEAMQGDRRAVAALIARHKHWLFRFVRRYVGDADDAQDMVQESFVAAVLNLARYDQARPFDAWLRRIALNKCRDRARRRAVRRAIGLEPRPGADSADAPDPAEPADRVLAADESLQALDRAIAQLPQALRAPLVLTSLEGLSHKEAGEILGLSVKAVELRIYRAKRQLALQLDRDGFSDVLSR